MPCLWLLAFYWVPFNKELLTGTVPVNKELFTGTVPVNKELLTGTVPVNNFYHIFKEVLIFKFLLVSTLIVDF